MKNNTFLLPLICSVLVSHSYAQGTFVYDQQSSDESYFAEGASQIQQSQPLGQSFTPSLSTVGFVRLQIYNGLFGNYTQADVVVHLRATSITGPILGTSTTLSIPGGALFVDTLNFFFDIPVTVTPGVSYYFQPEVLNNNNLGLSRSIFYNYAAGTAFMNGNADPMSDLWFREGIIVPEPSALALLFAGGGIATWLLHRNAPN